MATDIETTAAPLQSPSTSPGPTPDEKEKDTFQVPSRKVSMGAKTTPLANDEVSTNNRPGRETLVARIFTNGWAEELLTWIVAAMSMASVIIILAVFNNKSLPKWPYHIGLNTLISIFAQISSTALLGPISTCIGQLKWLWFTNRSQNLDDFEAFDRASRGPWSSVLLFWKTRASHLVSLGALLTIVSLAFQPFVQQSVSFPERLIPSGSAAITAGNILTIENLEGLNLSDSHATGQISPSTVAAIYNGLNGGMDLSAVAPNCTTGNCTWDIYDSLAICANPVANLTHLLNITDSACEKSALDRFQFCNYTLPNGPYLYGEDYDMNITSIQFDILGFNTVLAPAYPGSFNQSLSSIAFSDIPVVADFFIIYYSWSTRKMEAVECSLSFCGQTYNTSVKRGQTNTTAIKRWGQLNTTITVEGGFLINQTWPLVGDNTTFQVAAPYSSSLQGELSGFLTGYRYTNDYTEYIYSSTIAQIFGHALGASIGDILSNPSDDVEILSQLLEGLAIGLTNNIRTINGSRMVNGTAYSNETYVKVVWAWLILPLCIVFLALVFLVATIWQSRGGKKAWKSSSLAALSVLSSETKAKLGGLTSISVIGERAKGMKVKMEEDRDGWKLIVG